MSLPDFGVEGKVVIVTGASGGVGEALSLGFAEAGASLLLAARREAPLRALAEGIAARGARALVVPTDVTKGAEVSAMVRSCLGEFGRVDVLVNCAGGGVPEATLDMTEESWDAMVDFNLKSVFLCSRTAGKVMVEQGKGSIINFGTMVGQAPYPGYNHYAAAKAGVIQFTRVLAAEWGRYNVRVNCISPGVVDDDCAHSTVPNFERAARSTALGRAAQPEDLLPTALFLASDASSYITGLIVNVNGGPV